MLQCASGRTPRLRLAADALFSTSPLGRGHAQAVEQAAMAKSQNVPFPARACSSAFRTQTINRSVIALAAALGTSPALSAQDYPPGLFESSPVVPSGPRDATAPSGPPDATVPSGPPDEAVPFQPPDTVGEPDDYCAGVAFRTFHSLAEVRQAHARCDRFFRAAPLPPAAEGEPDD